MSEKQKHEVIGHKAQLREFAKDAQEKNARCIMLGMLNLPSDPDKLEAALNEYDIAYNEAREANRILYEAMRGSDEKI